MTFVFRREIKLHHRELSERCGLGSFSSKSKAEIVSHRYTPECLERWKVRINRAANSRTKIKDTRGAAIDRFADLACQKSLHRASAR